MKTLRLRIDSGFEQFARWTYRNRVKTLVLMALLVGAMLARLPTLTSDNSNESFFRPNDPALLAYNEFRDQFGRDELIMVAIRPPSVFDPAFLEKLRDFHAAIEQEVPHVREVTSLVNVRNTRGEGDELIVEDLLKELPRTPEAMAAFRQRVTASHLYPDLYISRDGTLTAVVVETLAFSPAAEPVDFTAGFQTDASDTPAAPAKRKTLSEAENRAIIEALEGISARFAGPDFRTHVSGSPVVVNWFNAAIGKNVGIFMSLSMAAFAVFLLVLFRRFSGAILPLLVVLVSMLSTIGLMAWFQVPFTSVTSVLPSFMISVGVGSSVHVLAIFYRRYRETENKEDAVGYTFGHSGLPIAMTGLTTAAGLMSFSTASAQPVADLGRFGGVGVLVILLFTTVLMPALLAVLPLRPQPRFAGRNHGHLMDRFLVGVANFSTRNAWAVVTVFAVIVAVASYGLVWQGFGHSLVRWLPHESDVRQNIELLDRDMNGAFAIEVVADFGQENALYEPKAMRDLEALAAHATSIKDRAGISFVGKTTSIVDVLKETHQALNGNDPAFYAIPDNRELIAQELLLFENSGSDDLQRLVDGNFSKARVSAKVRVKDASEYVSFVEQLSAEAQRLLGDRAAVTVTGTVKLFTQTIDLLMASMAKSYVIAGVIITVLMILMLGSYRIGLLSMIPNLAPIVITMGLMGWIGIRLDMSNMLLGTVAIGLAVDDTIHFFHNFRRYYAESGDAPDAVRKTMLSAGRAMLFTSLVLVTGFFIFMFASLINLQQFGFLVGATLIIALLADIMLAPAMMQLIARSERGRHIMGRWGRKEELAVA